MLVAVGVVAAPTEAGSAVDAVLEDVEVLGIRVSVIPEAAVAAVAAVEVAGASAAVEVVAGAVVAGAVVLDEEEVAAVVVPFAVVAPVDAAA